MLSRMPLWKQNTRCAMLGVRKYPNAVMGLRKLVAARWVQALKYNPSYSKSSICTEMHSQTMWESLLIYAWFNLATSCHQNQGKPESSVDFTETFTVTGKLGMLQSLSFCRTGSVQDAWTELFQYAAEWFPLQFPWLLCSSFKGRTNWANRFTKTSYRPEIPMLNSRMSSMHRNQKRSESLKWMMG